MELKEFINIVNNNVDNLLEESRKQHTTMAEISYRTSLMFTKEYINKLYNRIQKNTNDKQTSSSILANDVDGHTKYLQGIDLPIMINSIGNNDGSCTASKVCEMHIGIVDGQQTVLITPELIAIPNHIE